MRTISLHSAQTVNRATEYFDEELELNATGQYGQGEGKDGEESKNHK
tara:strand:- start:40 stop:180 length:141 start_codon:yes stop_codon:yes gene_type:complete